MRHLSLSFLALVCCILSTGSVAQTAPSAADCANSTSIDIGHAQLPPNVQRATAAGPRRIPHYPPSAVRIGRQADVTVGFVIDTAGGVTDIEILQSSGATDFDNAAIDEVKTWRYHPALCDGKPVAARTKVKIEWRLDNGLGPLQLMARPEQFPAGARDRGESGSTVLAMDIYKDGRFGGVLVEQSSGYADLDAAAGQVAYDWNRQKTPGDGQLLSKILVIVVWPKQDQAKQPAQ